MYENFSETFLWCITSLCSFVISLILTYWFYKDRNKRKLMFALGIALASFGYLHFIVDGAEGATLTRNFEWLAFPITLAVPIASLSSLLKLKNFETPFKIFLFGMAASMLLFFAQLPLDSLRIILMAIFVAISIPVLTYLYNKHRDSSDLIFLLVVLCFTFAGTTGYLAIATEVSILLYLFGNVFIGLMFVVPKNSSVQSMASFMTLERQLSTTKEELRVTQEKLLKAERLATIGELAGTIGHDLRNPLQGIAGATYYLKTRKNSILDDKGLEMLRSIETCIDRSNKIINDLLEYSKEIQLEFEETNPKLLMESTLRQIQVPPSVEIDDQTQSRPMLRVDKEKSERVFVNIIKNAFDAMPDGGRLVIKSEKVKGNVVFSFEDTGTGMSEEVLSKLWTPLFTTKAKGMGFGLAICKRIIEAHSGEIKAESELGKGSIFTVIFPLEPKPTAEGQHIYLSTPELTKKTNAMIAESKQYDY